MIVSYSKWKSFFLLAVIILSLSSCGERPNTQKPIEEVELEASQMNKTSLQNAVKSYEKEIAKKTQDLERVKTEAKSLSVSEVFGAKGEKVKTRITSIRTNLQELEKRLAIYQKYLAENS